MSSYATTATVQSNGQLELSGVPFPSGTAVEVLITVQRGTASDFAARWQELTAQLRSVGPEPSDQEIQLEIDAYRARR